MSGTQTEADKTELERRFFDRAEVVSLEIQVLKDTYDDILTAIERNGWEHEEGLRVLLTLGLGYAQGQRLLCANDEEKERLIGRLMDLESVAAVMKFRAFGLMRDNRVLEMQTGALRNTISGLEGMVKRLQEENLALRSELERVKAPDKA